MRWDRVAAVFIFIGLLTVGIGIVWRWNLIEDIDECGNASVAREVLGGPPIDCTVTTTPAIVALVIGGVLAIVGLALAVGADRS
jgi:hypothetical protein